MKLDVVVLVIVLAMYPAVGQSQESDAPPPLSPRNPQVQEEKRSTSPEEEPPAKKGSKVTRKLSEAMPDCVNLLFYHGCRYPTGQQKVAKEKAEERLAQAAERCRQLKAARPESLKDHPPQPDAQKAKIADGESSSRSSPPAPEAAPYCTAESVLAAEHDVEVGDFSWKEKNYRGAEMRYRSALEDLPGDPVASLQLARLLDQQGRSVEALAEYKSFLEWSLTGKETDEAKAAIARLEKHPAAQ